MPIPSLSIGQNGPTENAAAVVALMWDRAMHCPASNLNERHVELSTPDEINHSRRSPADRVAAIWSMGRWPALGLVAIAAFALGYIGFRAYFDGIGEQKAVLDIVYLTVQLFALESGAVPEAGAPWQLEVARFAAPATLATALAATAAMAFREQVTEWRLRHQRGHVVVCGLGVAGMQLSEALLESGRRVVGIDHDASLPAVDLLRRRGAVVIVGDAREAETLRRARVDRSDHLVCLTGAEDANAEITLQAAELTTQRKGPALECLAHIRDPDLCVLMRSEELASTHRRGIRLDFFNVDEQGARLLIEDYAPLRTTPAIARPPNLLIVGLNRLGQALAVELTRQWRASAGASEGRLQITVVDPDASLTMDRLQRRHPQLEHAADVTIVDADIDPLDTFVLPDVRPDFGFVCIDDDAVALHASLRLRASMPDPRMVIVVELIRARGIGGLIDHPGNSDHVHVFNLYTRTMRPELLLGGTYELLARAIHAEYVAERRGKGSTAEVNPSLVTWEELPRSLRESNRDQAADIGTKLAALSRGIAPLTEWDIGPSAFSDQEIEQLAELEHERWVIQRRSDGWKSGPKKVDAKTTPYLVEWDALTDEVKEWDRQAVRKIPLFLSRVGYQIVTPAER